MMKQKPYEPFYLKPPVPLQGDSLLFTIQSPGVSGTQLIHLGRMKGLVALTATQWFWADDPWIGNPVPLPLFHCSMNWEKNAC